MLPANFILKSVKYTPLLISQRWKIRILPKEHYDDDETPFFEKRKPKARPYSDVFAFLHRKHTWAYWKDYFKWKRVVEMKQSQSYITERHRILGPDLACAQFTVARKGRVKFLGRDTWTTLDDLKNFRIPTTYTPGYYVEEIDASETQLMYEGFENFCNLRKLKKLHLKKCPFVDDWCLGRFHLFANTLEYLDLSGCELVTERGICTLHVLRKLKTLVINDTPNIQNKELVTLLLQDVLPECSVIGVDFDDPILLKRLENYSS